MDFNSEDIEMMETEDNNETEESIGSQSNTFNTNLFLNKRNLCDMNETIDNNLKTDLSTKSSKISSIESRKILNAKRIKTSPKKGNDYRFKKTNSMQKLFHQMICVLDTNILLSNLCELKNIIISEEKRRKIDSNVTTIESIIIPWIVVQELDHLKSGKNGKKSKFSDITNAIHFINEQFKSNGLVKGENEDKSLTEMSKNRLRLVDEEINDDKIINCCLKFGCLKRVILVSNDINLCNKAFIKRLKAMNWEEFYEQCLDNQKAFESNLNVEDEPQTKRFAKSSSHSKTCDNSLPFRFSLSPKTTFINKNDSEVFNSSSESKTHSPVKCSSSKSSPSKIKSPIKSPIKSNGRKSTKSITNNNSIKKSPLKYDDWISFTYECEQKLMQFIVDVYQSIWKNDWKLMLEINTQNATLKDMIRLIRKEWFSNFSDIFNRDSSIKALVDNLHTNYHNQSNHKLLYSDLKKFISIVEEKQTSDGNSLRKRKTI